MCQGSKNMIEAIRYRAHVDSNETMRVENTALLNNSPIEKVFGGTSWAWTDLTVMKMEAKVR